MCGRIERALAAAFRYDANEVLRTHTEMQRLVARAPKGLGTQPDKYRYDVIFLKAPLTAAAAIKSVAAAPGVDEVHAGPGVLYLSRLIRQARLPRFRRQRRFGRPDNRGQWADLGPESPRT